MSGVVPGGVVRFDPATGRLGLDRAAFEVLMACVRDGVPAAGGPGGAVLLALRRAGVLVGDGAEPHPMLRGPLRTVLEPVGRVAVRLRVHGRPEARIDGWIGEAMAVLLVDPNGYGLPGAGADETGADAGPGHELLTVHRAFLPAVLARLTGVGSVPVPAAAGARPLEPGAAGTPLDGGTGDGGSVDQEDPVSPLEHASGAGAVEVAWVVGVGWTGEGGGREGAASGRAVRGRMVGATLWLDDPGEPAVPPKVASRTAAWRALVRLVSGAGEPVPAVSVPAGG